jgi:acylphosphatase
MQKKSYSVQLFGKVQGVFFRASTKEKAESLGINGFVRNESDGSVFIEAEGEEDNMRSFIEWCNHGPILARVDKCIVKEIEVKNFNGFNIKQL